MASRSVSPGAALLRSSRMFSIPNPIPAPRGDYTSATAHHSATATIPYPTRLSITTPSTSRVTGDWGFKRPLPLKTTTKQTIPLVRVRQMDSTEHVTDFQSASDHTMTLKKFQDLNLPISVPTARNNDKAGLIRRPKSVFEKERDMTALESDEEARDLESKRWKFKGPWLAGMTDGEFNRWLEKKVRVRRSEFKAYLIDAHAKELTEERQALARQQNQPIPPAVEASDITEADFMDLLRDLREDSLRLYRKVGWFLDLAPLNTVTERQYLPQMGVNRPQSFGEENPYSVNGPPVTHPSAGLSYLRTPNFMENHPIYGPQRYHPVVKARILKPRNSAAGSHEPAIGIAGFVVDRPTDQRLLGGTINNTPRGRALTQLELEGDGGTKLYYKVESATVDSDGRVLINVSDSTNKNLELVIKELLGEDGATDGLYLSNFVSKSSEEETGLLRRVSYNAPQRGIHVDGSRESYGFGRPTERAR